PPCHRHRASARARGPYGNDRICRTYFARVTSPLNRLGARDTLRLPGCARVSAIGHLSKSIALRHIALMVLLDVGLEHFDERGAGVAAVVPLTGFQIREVLDQQ